MTPPVPPRAPGDGPDGPLGVLSGNALRLAAVVAAALVLATLALGAQQVVPLLPGTDLVADDSFVRLERHGCYGTCPQYVVTVCSDGTVHYVGLRFVEETGPVEYAVPERRAHRLFRTARRVGYFDFRERYENNVVDDPSSRLTVRAGDETNVVDFDRDVGPDGLYRLANAVAAVAHPYADHRPGAGQYDGDVPDDPC